MKNKLHLEGEEKWKEVKFSGGSASGRGRGTGIVGYKDYTNGRSCWEDPGLYNGGGADAGNCDIGGRGFD